MLIILVIMIILSSASHLTAQDKVENIDRSREEQRYVGWSIFLSKKKVSGAYTALLSY